MSKSDYVTAGVLLMVTFSYVTPWPWWADVALIMAVSVAVDWAERQP